MRMLSRVSIPAAAERRIRREARSKILRERALALHQAGWTYARIGQALGVSSTRAHQIVRKARRLANDPRWFHDLPARAQTVIWTRGWSELGELEVARRVARLTRRELISAPNFGPVACDALAAWLAALGFELRCEPPADDGLDVPEEPPAKAAP